MSKAMLDKKWIRDRFDDETDKEEHAPAAPRPIPGT